MAGLDWTAAGGVLDPAFRRDGASRRRAAIVVACLLCAGAAAAQDQALRVTLTLDRTTIRLGERIVATVTVAGPAALADAQIRNTKTLGPFEVLAVRPRPASDQPGTVVWDLDLVVFETGRQIVAAVEVDGALQDGRAVAGRSADGVAVEVAALDVGATDALAPMTAPLVPPPRYLPTPRELAIAATAVAVALTALVAVRRWLIRRRTRPRWRELRAALAALAAGAAGAPATRAQWDTAARHVRQGVSWLAGRRLDALSSPELAAAAARRDKTLAPPIADVLAALDARRFGGPHAGGASLTEVAQRAGRVVERCETASRRPEAATR